MSVRDILLAFCVMLTWGVSFTVIKVGLDGVSPMLMGSLRFIVSAFPALFFIPRPKIAIRWWVAYGLTVGVGQFALLFIAIHLGMTAGVASVILQAQSFFTVIFASVLLRIKCTWPQILGLAIAAAGLWLLATGNMHEIRLVQLTPFILTLGAAACWGLSNVVVRMAANNSPKGEQFDLLGFTVWSSLIPPIPFALLAILIDGPVRILEMLQNFSVTSVGAICYLAYGGTLLGSGLFNKLLTKHSPVKVAPFTLLVPVFGVATSAMLLNEHLLRAQWFGGLLCLIGLLCNIFGEPILKRTRSRQIFNTHPGS